MGLKCSPEIAKSVVANILSGVDVTDVYIHDVGDFSSPCEDHTALLDMVLNNLCDNSFTINPIKCE